MKALLVIAGLLFLAAAVYSQESPPFLEGRWDDSVCNLIPNSARLYRQRTINYGKWNNKEQRGSWEYTEQVYSGNNCTATFLDYRVTYSGFYTQRGRQSDELPRFWHIEYNITKVRMEVSSQSFADFLNTRSDCAFPAFWFPNVEQTVDEATCPEVQLQPLSKCHIHFDIIRRENDRIFLGYPYAGEPPVYVAECTPFKRPVNYDPYGLLLFSADTGKPAAGTSYSTFDIDPFINISPLTGSHLVLSDHLGLSDLRVTGGASSLAMSLLMVALTFAMAIVF